MTSNAFAALQGLNDAQLPRGIVAGGGGKAKKPTAAAAAAASGNNSSNAPSSQKKPPLPATTVTATATAAGAEDDDDGFTPVVASRGKRADKQQASSSAPATTATATTTTAAPQSKKITKESRSASKTWADEIEEEEEEKGGPPSSNGNNADAAKKKSGKKTAAAADASSSSSSFLRDPLVWVDLEMTGLDPRTDTIIEIAVIVSDGQLQRVIEGPEIAIHHDDSTLEGMNEWSREQHAKSGLTARCRASKTSLQQAEEQVLEFVKKHCEYQAGIFAGNSVHVDRSFLMMHMPRLCEHLHYRIVDVSSVAELARRWHPRVWREAPKKKKAHTALADVRESLAELRYYRERLFNKRA
jgi:oligoribonuclease